MRKTLKICDVFGLFATIFASIVAAHGYDSLVRYDLNLPTDVAPFASATAPDGGIWLLAPGNTDAHQLVRLDANGNRSTGVYLPTRVDSDNSDRFTIYPLADGGVLELDTHRRSQFETACILRSITREGLLRFERNVRQPSCRLQIGELGRAPYLLTNIDSAIVISEDGSLASSFLSPGNSSLIRAEFVADHELLLLHSNAARTGYVLDRADVDGRQLWSKPLENVRFDQSVSVRELSDGHALVLISDVSKLQMRFYSTAGDLIETREIAMLEATQASFGDWSSDAQGNLALTLRFEVALSSASYGAIFFAANANVLKQIRYAPTDRCTQQCPLLGLAQGFANALGTATGGKLVFTSLLPNVPNTEIALPASFNARIANSNNATILMTSDAAVRAFNASGTEIATPSLIFRGGTQTKILATTIASDGKIFVAHQRYGNGQFMTQLEAFTTRFSFFDPKLWQRTIPNVASSQLWANNTRVCFSLMNSGSSNDATLTCLASATGAQLLSIGIPNVDAPKMRARFLADGRLRVVFARGATGIKIVDVLTNNLVSQVSIATNQVNSIIDISTSGSILLAATIPDSSNAVELWALRPAGEIAFRRTIPEHVSLGQLFGRILENSDVLMSLPSAAVPTTIFETLLLNADGVQRWAVASPRVNDDDVLANSLTDEKNVYLMRRSRAAAKVRVYALSLTNGSSAWTQELKGFGIDVLPRQDSETDLFAAPNGNEVLVAIDRETGVQLSRLSDTNGFVREQRLLECGAATCASRATMVTNSGDFIAFNDAQQFGAVIMALGRASVATTAPEISADQTGLSGAWYTPQISGQGFFFEYFPQNKLLFAPWFTFSVPEVSSSGAPVGSDSVADLRWYTLSGIVEPGAKVARFDIRRNIAGVFNSAPITESGVVGSATLRAQDCNRATLEFEFIGGEAGGKFGVLPLDRLTGGTAPCQLSGGQTLPGRDGRPARGGFDGRQSGSWYQPQTAGQGLMMTVQPATASAPGFFFGGWFTYDAGVPNDPTSQHWLTLSGEIPVNAQAGVVPVTIYRTLGGQLGAVPTQNNAILGQGTVTFSGCASAVLRYQFDDTLIAGAFRARTGEISLERLGACPAQ